MELVKRVHAQNIVKWGKTHKDVIVLSAVRANEAGEMGFLTDRRRLNVAITRARRGLIVLGHPRTLRNDSSWASWCDWASERGLEAYHVLHM